MRAIKKYNIHLAWIISVVATLGSLSFSKIFGFIPCELCWYQRILMYPLVINLGIGVYYNDHKIKRFILPFTLLGLIMSFYHILIQKLTLFKSISPCTADIPCSVDYLNWFNFITIPMLSFVAFLLITILTFLKK